MNEPIFEIGERNYPIEDCYIVGFFEEGTDKQIQWNIVVEFPGDEAYASFENISFSNVKNFQDLENKTFILEEDDLEENFIYEGVDEELVYVEEIHFGSIDKENLSIDIEIQGIAANEIYEDEDTEEIEIEGDELNIKLNAQFEGIYFITQNKNHVENFVKKHLNKPLDEVEIEFEEDEEGVWNCIITYP